MVFEVQAARVLIEHGISNLVWRSASVGYRIPNRRDSLRRFQPRQCGTEACFAAHLRAGGLPCRSSRRIRMAVSRSK